jgi:hypothetical protein
MRHRRILAALLTLAIAGVVRADTTASGISGVVLNATCPGPCSVPPKPLPPYQGDNLVVTIKKLPERILVARLRPTDGTFGIELDPGLYRVRARIKEQAQFSCWEGSHRKVEVFEGMISRVRLRVTNICVL